MPNAAKDNVPSPTNSQEWVLDAQGNWDTMTTNGTPQNRTHNRQNQINTIVAYNANGAMTTDEQGRTLTYDAWGRLVQVANGSTHVYAYDALNRRITETVGTTTDLYYSAQWQVLEERQGTAVKVQQLWSPVYVDALILRDRDTGGDPDLDERPYVQQDANWNVTAVANPAGQVLERLPTLPADRLGELLPHRWQAARSAPALPRHGSVPDVTAAKQLLTVSSPHHARAPGSDPSCYPKTAGVLLAGREGFNPGPRYLVPLLPNAPA